MICSGSGPSCQVFPDPAPYPTQKQGQEKYKAEKFHVLIEEEKSFVSFSKAT
jgi:hypothetical protein